MYKLLFARQYEKQLKKIPKDEQVRIINKIEKISGNPRVYSIKLASIHPPIYKLRVGNYRVFFEIDDEKKMVIITDVRRRTTQTYRHIS